MKISPECISEKGELLQAEWYYTRKLLEAETEDEAKCAALYWHCTNELIKKKYQDHRRELYGGKDRETLQRGHSQAYAASGNSSIRNTSARKEVSHSR